MSDQDMTEEQVDLLVEHANDLVREQTAAFLAELDTKMHARFGGWEFATACWRQDLDSDPAGQVARAVVQAMGGNIC